MTAAGPRRAGHAGEDKHLSFMRCCLPANASEEATVFSSTSSKPRDGNTASMMIAVAVIRSAATTFFQSGTTILQAWTSPSPSPRGGSQAARPASIRARTCRGVIWFQRRICRTSVNSSAKPTLAAASLIVMRVDSSRRIATLMRLRCRYVRGVSSVKACGYAHRCLHDRRSSRVGGREFV